MNKEKGVTFLELLLVIIIMVTVSSVVFRLVDYSLSMERVVANENELQREARFILEQISEGIQNGGTFQTTDPVTLVNKNGDAVLVLNEEGNIEYANDTLLSENVTLFSVTKTGETFMIVLKLEKAGVHYEVSTGVSADQSARLRY